MIELRNINLNYHDVKALSDVNISFRDGEIHALIGNNGAGKTTLIQLLSGLVRPTSGEILIDGKYVVFSSALDSLHHGIAVCQQDENLFEELSITENLFLGNEQKTKVGLFDWHKMDIETKKLLDMFRIDAYPRQKVRNLSSTQRNLLQFVRITLLKPRILVVDELTDSLAHIETEMIFRTLKSLRDSGMVVIYVTHRIKEALSISDRITILRDGRVCSEVKSNSTMPETIAEMMIGSMNCTRLPKIPLTRSKKLMVVSHISTNFLDDISFSLNSGEALGIAGLMGSGRSSLLRAIAGVDGVNEGTISILSDETSISKKSQNVHKHIAYIPDNEDKHALFPNMSTAANITIRNLERISYGKIISSTLERIRSSNYANMIGVRTHNINNPIKYMSNGNKQKALVARNVFSKCKIFVFDEATKGVDSAGKVEIYNIMNALLRKGAGILLVSTDFEELIGMCDRVLVIKKGRLIAEFKQTDVTQHKLNVILNE